MIIKPSKVYIFWIKTAKVSHNPINNSRFQTSVCTKDINGDINDTYIYRHAVVGFNQINK